jgi:hypothetical protein
MTNGTLTDKVIYEGLVKSDDGLRIFFHKHLRRPDGKEKVWSGSALVQDSALLQRLQTEVSAGDEIEIITRTDWEADDLPTMLLDFGVLVVAEQARDAA